MLPLLAFLSGAAIEMSGVWWIHYSERGAAWSAGLCSALQATALVYGINASAADMTIGSAFVAGYALGTVGAVSAKRKAG